MFAFFSQLLRTLEKKKKKRVGTAFFVSFKTPTFRFERWKSLASRCRASYAWCPSAPLPRAGNVGWMSVCLFFSFLFVCLFEKTFFFCLFVCLFFFFLGDVGWVSTTKPWCGMMFLFFSDLSKSKVNVGECAFFFEGDPNFDNETDIGH